MGEAITVSSHTANIQENDIVQISRDTNQGKETKTKELNTSVIYTTPGTKVIKQSIEFIDGGKHTNFLTIDIQDPDTETEVKTLSVIPSSTTADTKTEINLKTVSNVDSDEILSIMINRGSDTREEIDPTQKDKGQTHTFAEPGTYNPMIIYYLRDCQVMQAQTTISIYNGNSCLDALQNGSL